MANYVWNDVHCLKDAFTSIINCEFLSDIKFQFADNREIFAHSFVLSLRSSEFYESLKTTIGTTKLINITDSSYDVFLEFIKFFYIEKCEINETNILELFELSKKYCVDDLELQCRTVMLSDVNVDNVFDKLDKSLNVEWNAVQNFTLHFIANNFLQFIEDEKLYEINSSTLKAILSLDEVSDIYEFAIFNAITKWAARACTKDGVEVNACEKRIRLGDNLKLIRFASMTAEDFGKCIQQEPGLFTDVEISTICVSIITNEKNSMGFNKEKRRRLKCTYDVCTGIDLFDKGKPKPLDSTFALEFSTTNALELIGINIVCPNGKISLVLSVDGKDVDAIEEQCFSGGQTLKFKNKINVEENKKYQLTYTFSDVKCENIECFEHGKYLPWVFSQYGTGIQITFHTLSPHIFNLHYTY